MRISGSTASARALTGAILPSRFFTALPRAREPIEVADLEEAEAASGRLIAPGNALLMHTGVDKFWGEPGFSTERPFLPVASAQWMVDREIGVFGTDLIGMDDPDEWWWLSHRVAEQRLIGVSEFLFAGPDAADAHRHRLARARDRAGAVMDSVDEEVPEGVEAGRPRRCGN